MWRLPYAEELDNVISRTNEQASSLGHSCLVTTSQSEHLKHVVNDAQALVAGASESIRKREAQLQQESRNCMKLRQGSTRAKITIENITSYNGSKQKQGAATKSLVLHDNPISYLKGVVEIYSKELRACDVALNDMQWTAPVKASNLEKEDITLQGLVAATKTTISELTSNFQRIP